MSKKTKNDIEEEQGIHTLWAILGFTIATTLFGNIFFKVVGIIGFIATIMTIHIIRRDKKKNGKD